MTLTGVLWGSIGVVVRLLQDSGLPTLSIAFWRLVCACVVLVPLLARLGRLRGIAWRSRRLVAVSVGSLAFQLLFFVAVRDAGVAVATLVALGLAPVALAVAEAVRDRVVPDARALAVLACALAGLALVTGSGGTAGPRRCSASERRSAPGWRTRRARRPRARCRRGSARCPSRSHRV